MNKLRNEKQPTKTTLWGKENSCQMMPFISLSLLLWEFMKMSMVNLVSLRDASDLTSDCIRFVKIWDISIQCASKHVIGLNKQLNILTLFSKASSLASFSFNAWDKCPMILFWTSSMPLPTWTLPKKWRPLLKQFFCMQIWFFLVSYKVQFLKTSAFFCDSTTTTWHIVF